MPIGYTFYAVKVVTREDGVTLYLTDHVNPECRGQYARASLDGAATFPDRERAEILLDTFPELHAEVVALRAVVAEGGNWRGWHATSTDKPGDYRLNGPSGEMVSYRGGKAGLVPDRPWSAQRPDGTQIYDTRCRIRAFTSALTARRALAMVMKDEW